MNTADIQVTLIPGMTFDGKQVYPRAWPIKPGSNDLKPLMTVTLQEALTCGWHADGVQDGRCYISQWKPIPGLPVRLKGEAIKTLQGELSLQLILTDIDALDKGKPGHDAEVWFTDQRRAIDAFLAEHPGAFIACSRGGLRIYQALDAPFVLNTPARATEWKDRYAAWLTHVERFPWAKAKVDGACKDWTRLQRIPHDTRDGVLQVYSTVGDSANIGVVTLPNAPARKPRAATGRDAVAPYTGPTVEARVAAGVLTRLAAVWPQPGQGCWEAALALGGVLSHSHWSTDDCVEFASALFDLAGVQDRSESQVRASIENARSSLDAGVYGWPKLRARLVGDETAVRLALATLESEIPGLTPEPLPASLKGASK